MTNKNIVGFSLMVFGLCFLMGNIIASAWVDYPPGPSIGFVAFSYIVIIFGMRLYDKEDE